MGTNMILFFFLLPALAYGEMSVFLDVTRGKPLADAGGRFNKTITTDLRNTFQIDDEKLKKYIANYSGEVPVDVYVGDTQNFLHAKFPEWRNIKVSVRPFWEVFVQETCHNSSESYDNQHLSVNITWSNDYKVNVTEPLHYLFKIPDNTIEFPSLWQTDEKIDKLQNFTATPSVVQQCTMSADVQYEVSVFGDVAVDFGKKFNGHYYWAFDIANVLEKVSLPTTIEIKENIVVQYYKRAPLNVTK